MSFDEYIRVHFYLVYHIIQANSGSHITLLSTDLIINRDVRKFVVHLYHNV